MYGLVCSVSVSSVDKAVMALNVCNLSFDLTELLHGSMALSDFQTELHWNFILLG